MSRYNLLEVPKLPSIPILLCDTGREDWIEAQSCVDGGPCQRRSEVRSLGLDDSDISMSVLSIAMSLCLLSF